ncbi:chromosome-associated kinesin KIF4-like [Venturia canescens]|uniref:chromosome-associated kinesin KIF4-like n=1 Tax=Venturia canescens TaxID=32260 RepID=UPI001C9C7C22|nr:chromosome-associated kinesin KIF4-like [Venturia canescens]
MVSFIKLYQEQLYDLLADREDDKKEIKIVGLTERPVANANKAFEALNQGSNERATGATAMNTQSSRSQKNDDPNTATISKFYLVDLAGLGRNSLGRHSITLMIACISLVNSNLSETLRTLRYADRARKIKNKPIINKDPKAAEINRPSEAIQEFRLAHLDHGTAIGGCPPEHGFLQKKLQEMTEQLNINLI